jgi:hypothetical protein
MPLILATQEWRLGGSLFEVTPGKKLEDLISANKLDIVAFTFIPARQEGKQEDFSLGWPRQKK